jgi:hypothetical protein
MIERGERFEFLGVRTGCSTGTFRNSARQAWSGRTGPAGPVLPCGRV